MKMFKKNYVEESQRFLAKARQGAYTAPVIALFTLLLDKFNGAKWCESFTLSEGRMAAEFNIPKSTVHAATQFLIERGHLYRSFDRGLSVWSLEPLCSKNPATQNSIFLEKNSIIEGQSIHNQSIIDSGLKGASEREFSPPNHNSNEEEGNGGRREVAAITTTIQPFTNAAKVDGFEGCEPPVASEYSSVQDTVKEVWLSSSDYAGDVETPEPKPEPLDLTTGDDQDERKAKERCWQHFLQYLRGRDKQLFDQCKAVIGLKEMKELYMTYDIKKPLLYFMKVAKDYQKRDTDKLKRAAQIKNSPAKEDAPKLRLRPEPDNLNNLFCHYSNKPIKGNWLPNKTPLTPEQVDAARKLVERAYPEYSFDESILRACVRFRNSRSNMKDSTFIAKVRDMQREHNREHGVNVVELQEDINICAEGVSACEVRHALAALAKANLTIDDLPPQVIFDIICDNRDDWLARSTSKFAEKFRAAVDKKSGTRNQELEPETINIPQKIFDMPLTEEELKASNERDSLERNRPT